MTENGWLVALEGLDGAGKTTVADALTSLEVDVSTPFRVCGERQSALGPILDTPKLRTYSALLKTHLFAADRAWTLEQVATPILSQNGVVVWDRYIDSAFAYRGAEIRQHRAGVLTMDFVRDVNSCFRPPDLSILIAISPETSVRRTGASRQEIPFLRVVADEYRNLEKQRKYVVINGEHEVDVVRADVAQAIRNSLPESFK